jgi:hypothetical protein
MSAISSEKVNKIFTDSLFRDSESHDRFVPAHGIMHSVAFQTQRLVSHRDEVAEMLREIPDEFHSRAGGGMSFLKFCQTRDGIAWGEHNSGEELVLLGEGLGMISCIFDRAQWGTLPGGMPYYVVNDDILDHPESYQVVEIISGAGRVVSDGAPRVATAAAKVKTAPSLPRSSVNSKEIMHDAVTQRKAWVSEMTEIYNRVGDSSPRGVNSAVSECLSNHKGLSGKHLANFRLASDVFRISTRSNADTVKGSSVNRGPLDQVFRIARILD